MVEDKKELKEIPCNKESGFKNKLNLYNQNNNSSNNEIKSKENLKQNQNSSRSGSISIQERINLINNPKKEEIDSKTINKEDKFKKKRDFSAKRE